jgi:hypothetical protein
MSFLEVEPAFLSAYTVPSSLAESVAHLADRYSSFSILGF